MKRELMKRFTDVDKSNSAPLPSAPIYQPQSESPAPVYVTAVPVENIPHATVTAYCVAEDPQNQNQLQNQHIGRGESQDVGVCRRCGRQFNRPPGSHDSSAQYYRCPDCARFHLQDFLCIVS
mmetsp:Transcript_24897/g.23886  ORF Transcript_24897/g.23886 Transcript_24897/m.23886 type:complete len:122 (+) Transcript_24897:121-486(+)